MGNEIQEILEFNENADYKKLSVDEIVILKDYITNLQNGFKSTVEELCETTEELEGYKQERDKFKSRNQKAIEYIKQHTEQRIYQEPYNIDGYPDRVEYFIEGKWNLLDILQGDDKDVENNK